MLFKSLFKLTLYTALTLLLYSCTTLPSNNNEIEEAIKNDIIGKNLDHLYSKWGPPTRNSSLPSHKGEIHIWRHGYKCKSIVTTNNDSVVTDYSVTGNCTLVK